jgi:hypothetical protein
MVTQKQTVQKPGFLNIAYFCATTYSLARANVRAGGQPPRKTSPLLPDDRASGNRKRACLPLLDYAAGGVPSPRPSRERSALDPDTEPTRPVTPQPSRLDAANPARIGCPPTVRRWGAVRGVPAPEPRPQGSSNGFMRWAADTRSFRGRCLGQTFQASTVDKPRPPRSIEQRGPVPIWTLVWFR